MCACVCVCVCVCACVCDIGIMYHVFQDVAVHPELQQWQASVLEYESNWAQLSATIKGAAIDPIIVDCIQSSEEMLTSATKQMEGNSDACLCVCVFVCLCVCVCTHTCMWVCVHMHICV